MDGDIVFLSELNLGRILVRMGDRVLPKTIEIVLGLRCSAKLNK